VAMSLRMMLLARTATIVIMAGVSLVAASAASARTYTVYGCRTPTGAKAPLNDWQGALDSADNTTHEFWGGTCPGPRYLKLDPAFTHLNGANVEATFIAPADTTITSYSIERAVRLVPSAGYLYEAWALSAGRWLLVDGCTTASLCGIYGDVSNLASSSNLLRLSAPADTTEFQFKLVCARSGGCPRVNPQSDSVWMWSSAMTLEDDYSPQFAGPPSGPLVAPSGALAGTVPVSIGATDRGGGVYQAIVAIDGRVVQAQVLNNNGGLCQAPFLAAVPCQLSASGTVFVNTAAVPDGVHSLTLLVSDAAGNTAAWGPIEIVTSNNLCSRSPVAGGLGLRAEFAIVTTKRVRVHRRWHVVKHVRLVKTLTTSYGHHPIVVGSFTSPGGLPLAGAGICVAAQDDILGAPLRTVGRLTTSAGGDFTYRLGIGASRTIYFVHRVADGAIATAVHVLVRVPVKVHVNRRFFLNGHVMTWSGRLHGPVPSGLLGLMQVWRGTFWQTFETVGVGPKGGWVGRYRFSFTTGVQHYLFRLKVPHQTGYPYAAGVSSPIHVTVAG
jgi:hypothetical protein